MNDRTLNVYMDGTFTGNLTMNASGALAFTYDSAYVALADATPLSLSMPVGNKRYGNKIVLPFLQGLLPDNATALGAMAADYGVSAASPFALLEYMGHDVAGALQIVSPCDESEDAMANRTSMQPITDAELAERLKKILTVYDGDSPAHDQQRMSLAGAQAKIALAKLPNGNWAIPERGVPTTHIFKPQPIGSTAFPEADVVELFCERVVEAAGIPAAQTALWAAPDRSVQAIVSTRYDRKHCSDGTYRRLHQEDLCQALSVSPTKKYQRTGGGPGIRQVGQLFRTKLAPEDASTAARAFLAELTANVFLLNTDAHAKNYSLLLQSRRASLAPMYDVLSIAPYLAPDEHPKFSMRLGKTYDLEQVFPETLTAEGSGALGLDAAEAETVVGGTIEALRRALPKVASSKEMQGLNGTGIVDRTAEGILRHSKLAAEQHTTTATATTL